MHAALSHRSGFVARHTALFEQLEERAFFSAPYDIVGVGVRYDAVNGPAVYFAEGTLGADDSISGTMRLASVNGVGQQAIDWASLTRGERGAMTLGTRDGFEAYASQYGTQFVREERWLQGSFAGYDADGLPRDVGTFGEVFEPTDVRIQARGNWLVQFSRVTEGGIEFGTLDIYLDLNQTAPFSFVFTYHFSGGDVADSKTLVSTTDGRLTFDTGEIMILQDDQGTAMVVDFDGRDGVIGVGAGLNVDSSSVDPGWFRGSVSVMGDGAAAFLGVAPSARNALGIGVADVVIQLDYFDYSGTGPYMNRFSIFDGRDWDNGVRTLIRSGDYEYQTETTPVGQGRSVVHLIGGNMDRLQLALGPRGVLTPKLFDPVVGPFESVSGVLAHARPISILDGETLADVGPGGRPRAYQVFWEYEHPGDAGNYAFDLIDEAGGEPVVGDVVVWTNLGNAYGPRTFVAGVSAEGDLQLWSRDQYSWTYTNLTEALQARAIAPELFSTIYSTSEFARGDQFLAAYDTDGKLVVFHQDITAGYPQYAWEFVDAELDGLDGLGSIPSGLSALSGWSSSWRAGHFAGIDADGELWSIWWAPGMERWRVDSLTAAASLPALVGSPAAVVTSWDTLHVSALDGEGHTRMVWWARENNEWRGQDLTSDFGGPVFEQGTLLSGFGAFSGTLNVGGVAEDGEFKVYWWSAGRGWQVDSLMDGLGAESLPLEPRRMTSAVWGITSISSSFRSQSVLGHDGDGDLVRLLWRSDRGEGWFFENVTETAVGYWG